MTPSPAARLLGLTFKRAIGPVLVIVEDHRGVADNLLLLVIRNHTAPYLHLLVGEMLREKMLEEQNYQIAMQQYLSHPPSRLKIAGERLPVREALYERKSLR